MSMMTTASRFSLMLLGALLLGGCQSMYYKAAESVGYNKREIMVDRVENAQEAQTEAQEQFVSALDKFRSIVQFEGGDLEALYNELNEEFEESQGAAQTVRDRIASVKDVSEALFSEWEEELELYTNPTLKASSARRLKETRALYGQMISSMDRSAQKMDPVLNAFQDQVLYLKHNLNAKAIASLKGEFVNIKGDIDRLIADMKQSIARSNSFIEKLK